MGWSLLPLPSLYSVTSTEQSLQRVVTTSITIYVQWNLNWTVPPKGSHHLYYHPCTVEPLLNGPSNGWTSPPLPSVYSGTSTERSLQRVVTTSITTRVQWNLNWTVPPKGVHHLHYYPYAVASQLDGPSNGWSPPPFLSMYSGTSTEWSLQSPKVEPVMREGRCFKFYSKTNVGLYGGHEWIIICANEKGHRRDSTQKVQSGFMSV